MSTLVYAQSVAAKTKTTWKIKRNYSCL